MTAGRVPPAVRVLPARVYYGWYIAAATFVVMFVGVGVSFYGLAVFLRPLQVEHGWSNTVVSAASGVFFSVSGLAAAVAGSFIDRIGPRHFMIFGATGLGVCVALIGYVDAVWQLFAVYLVLGVCFGVSTNVAVSAILTRWFVQLRGRAMSLSAAGVSAGGIAFAPLGTYLISVGGLPLATTILGAVVVAVIVPVTVLVIAWRPDDLGLEPDGGSGGLASGAPPRLDPAGQRRTWTRRSAARTPQLWVLTGAFVLVIAAQVGFVFHQVAFLEDRLGSPAAASFCISLVALGSLSARLVVAAIADRVSTRWLTSVLMLVQAAAVLALVHTDSKALTYMLALVFGSTIGNIFLMQALLVGEIYGMVSFGTVFGLVTLASQGASGLGPFVIGVLEQRTGGYTTPFTITACLTVLAAVLVVFARPVPGPLSAGEDVALAGVHP